MSSPSNHSNSRRILEVLAVLVIVAAVVGFSRNMGSDPITGSPWSASGSTATPTPALAPPPDLPKVAGVEITRVKRGNGEPLAKGQAGSFHYTGWLDGFNGRKFDSSLDRDQSFSFSIGNGLVIAGWDQGLIGMQLKEVRRLKIAPEMAYGADGVAHTIPPNSTLYFEVEYLGLAKE